MDCCYICGAPVEDIDEDLWMCSDCEADEVDEWNDSQCSRCGRWTDNASEDALNSGFCEDCWKEINDDIDDDIERAFGTQEMYRRQEGRGDYGGL